MRAGILYRSFCSLTLYLLLTSLALAESFIVEDIRIEGLERISAGTVFNYLPVKVGDTFEIEAPPFTKSLKNTIAQDDYEAPDVQDLYEKAEAPALAKL